MHKFFWTMRAVLYCFVMGEVGLPSYIGKPCFMTNRRKIKLGKMVRIYPGIRAEVGSHDSFLEIQDYTSIGQNFHVVSFGSTLMIGKNVTISGNVLITNCDHEYQQIGKHVLEQGLTTKKTSIGDYCFIGYGAVIQAGTILGKHCVVGANAVVRGKFGNYEVIVGNPAKVIKRYDFESKQWKRV